MTRFDPLNDGDFLQTTDVVGGVCPGASDKTLILDTNQSVVVSFDLKTDEGVEWVESTSDTEARPVRGRQRVTATLVIGGKFEEQLEAGWLEFRYLGTNMRARIKKRWCERQLRRFTIGRVFTPELPRFTTHFDLLFLVNPARGEVTLT